MKKKLFAVLLLCLISISSVFASLGYQFDLYSFDPLHKEYFADRTSSDLSIGYLNYFDGLPDRILQDAYEDGEKVVHVFNFDKDLSNGSMMQVKVGETISIARNTFSFNHWLSPIAFDVSAQALIQSFYTEGFDNGIGYDGIYFYGATARVADKLSMRVGYHHYCSHYGDQVIKLIKDDFANFNMGYKYIRMNGIVLGLSLDPTAWLRLYGELDFPESDITLRPIMFAPSWQNNINSDYEDSYNARIVTLGFELTYPIFKSLGDTTFGYDLHMYEEGKVEYNHVSGGPVDYNPDGSWELEHNIKIAQDINDLVSFEVYYHKGRSPFNNFYYSQCSYLGIGFRLDSDATFTLFDSENK